MSVAESYLKTQRVADALGVSVSTVKRWVDSGMIRAARTQGRHRLIPMSEAIRLAQEQGLKIAPAEVMAAIGPVPVKRAPSELLYMLEDSLRSGRTEEAQRLVLALYASGCSAVELADGVIRVVMGRIGHAWQVGSIDVFNEHQATRTLESALMELNQRVRSRQDASGPLAIGAAPAGDPYTLPALLGELVLREEGYRVRNLGVNLPLRSLAQAVLEYRPSLIFLSVSHLEDPERFVEEFADLERAVEQTRSALIVGGRALGEELRARLVFTAHGDSMAHLAQFARGFARLSAPATNPTAHSGESSTQ